MGLGSGSGKNLFRIPDPGVKKAPDPGSGSATLVKSVKSLNYFLNLFNTVMLHRQSVILLGKKFYNNKNICGNDLKFYKPTHREHTELQ